MGCVFWCDVFFFTGTRAAAAVISLSVCGRDCVPVAAAGEQTGLYFTGTLVGDLLLPVLVWTQGLCDLPLLAT